MKKTIIAAVLISGLAIATVSSANWGRGGGRGYNADTCPQLQSSLQADPAVQAKLDTFYNDTAALRKEMVVKQSEKRAIMRGANPDPAVVAKLTGELFDLRTAMRAQAVEAGVSQYVGPRMGAGDRGMGRKGGKGGGRGGWGQGATSSN